ncbi:MAG: FAD-dependent thymidylate synthase [Kiritimatiellia bacterium]|jgi:thymidylate synthase (FAD)
MANDPSLPADLPAPRASAPELDAILGARIPVLDDGFVRPVDYLGNDAAIVQAARVSYGAGTKQISQDRGLIRYLLRHRHTSPLEMCEIKLHIRAPMDCWRQWVRHRTASVNEYSTRYSVAIDAAQRTSPDAWRAQSTDNRQGSGGFLPDETGAILTQSESVLHRMARDTYEARLAIGVAREQARKDLPLSTYTEAYWKIDLHNLLHFLELRMTPHAQLEIREYAEAIGNEIVARWVPFAWEAFQDYRLASMELSRLDLEQVNRMAKGDREAAQALQREWKWVSTAEDGALRKGRESRELDAKLARLGLPPVWA